MESDTRLISRDRYEKKRLARERAVAKKLRKAAWAIERGAK
jgi:hypothetical protein